VGEPAGDAERGDTEGAGDALVLEGVLQAVDEAPGVLGRHRGHERELVAAEAGDGIPHADRPAQDRGGLPM
jgi:hypothetical protein